MPSVCFTTEQRRLRFALSHGLCLQANIEYLLVVQEATIEHHLLPAHDCSHKGSYSVVHNLFFPGSKTHLLLAWPFVHFFLYSF